MSSRVTKLTLSYLSTLLITSVCGTQYLFSAYSTALQDRLGFTSVQINTIGSFANYGVFLSKPFFGYISDNHGSQRTCFAASLLIFISYLCLALTYQQIIPSTSFMLCSLYLFCAGIASSGGLVSSMVTITKNFTSLRGTALSVPIALFGLSAFMYSQINMHFFQNDTFHFILFISTSAGLCLFIGSWFIVVVPPPLPTTTTAVVESINELEEGISNNNNNSNLFTEQTPLLLQQKQCKNEQRIESDIDGENDELDIGGWELVHNKDAIRLVLIMIFIGGVGLMYINNVGAIIKSLYYAPSTQPSHSSHPFHPSHLSRPFHPIHPSFKDLRFLSDLAKYLYGIPRISFLGLAALWLLIGQMLILFWIQQVDKLWMVTCFVGFGYGIQYGTAPTIAGELFGSKRFGLNWGLLACVS
ncbi:5788_t:CDS:2 [Diversispora eburnea]|uniref:5788_t:CDS:1 n=1 Tax=Diversispora eburnea TaxID=1213867 RepID=A0A9N9F507_9GLOM|nr:5788_t:CDS:2 [Diversispora eburnea]